MEFTFSVENTLHCSVMVVKMVSSYREEGETVSMTRSGTTAREHSQTSTDKITGETRAGHDLVLTKDTDVCFSPLTLYFFFLFLVCVNILCE